MFCWIPSHVNIRGNDLADKEAKAALNLPESTFRIRHSDFKSQINKYIKSKCQTNWDNQIHNKLRQIKPDFHTKDNILSNRKEQTVTTGCRIGHTRITHSFLLNNEVAPFCIPCNEVICIKHLLVSCIDFNHIRSKHYNIKTVTELFSKFLLSRLLIF